MDSRSFDGVIVTPSGTPLGGWVHLDVDESGGYHVKFHMHSSSVLGDFDFQIRAYLQAPDCPVIFFYHEGHVSGVDDSDYEESGSNPLIAMYWSKFVAAPSFSVAKDYEWGGVVGAVEGLVKDLLDITGAVAGGVLGTVIGVTREAIGWLGATLGPGGTIGVIAGVVVFTVAVAAGAPIGAAFILGVVTGVVAGAVTNAMIKYRPMNDAEIALARRVFGDTLPYGDVILTNLAGLGGRAFTAPGVDGKTYCNLGDGYDDTLGSGRNAYPFPGQLLIHELTHAWQIAHTSFLPGLMCSGMVNQANYVMGDNVYQYGAAGPNWTDFNAEQQGAIVDQWFGGNHNSQGYRTMDQRSPYYRYIWNDVLGRRPSPSAPGNLPSSPAFAVGRTPEHLDVFWVGPDWGVGSNWWDQNANNGAWNQPFGVAPPNSAQTGSVAAVWRMPTHLDAFWVALDGSVWSNWWDQNANNGAWNQPFAIAPPRSAQAGAIAACSRTPEHVDVFWIGPDGGVGTTWWDSGANNGAWNQPFGIAPPGSAQPGALAAVARTANHVDAFWVGPDGGIGTAWWDSGANNGAWNQPFGIAPPGAAQPGAIASCCRTPEHVDVFWVGPDGGIGTAWWDSGANNGAWNQPFGIAPPGASQPGAIAACSRTPEHVDVFWIGPDGGVGTTWWDSGANNAAWNQPFGIAPPGASQPGAIAGCCRTPEHVDVFWIGPDGGVGSNWWDSGANNGAWNQPFGLAPPGSAQPGWQPPGRVSSPLATARVSNHLDAFWVGPDGGIGSNWWDVLANHGLWNQPFGLAPAGSAAHGGAVAAVARSDHHLDVFWVGPDGGIGSNWWDAFANNGAWNQPFAVAPPGSAPAGSDVAGVGRMAHHLDVFWVAPDGSVRSNWWDAFANNGTWNQPFEVAPAGSAAHRSGIAAAARVAHHLDVFWVAPDGSVRSNWWDAFANHGAWNQPFEIAPPDSAAHASGVAAVGRTAYHLDAFWVAPDGSVRSNWWDLFANHGAWNQPFEVAPAGSARPGSPLSVTARVAHHLDVFWIAPDGSVRSNWWDAFANHGAWNQPFDVAPAGSARAGSPIGSAGRTAYHLDAFWVGPDGSVRSNWWDLFANNGVWNQPFDVAPAGAA